MYNSWYLFIITALSVVSIIISYPTQREKKFSLASCLISLVKNKFNWDKQVCRSWRKLSVSTRPSWPIGHNNNGSTNSKNLGWFYPFTRLVAIRGSVQETCVKTVISWIYNNVILCHVFIFIHSWPLIKHFGNIWTYIYFLGWEYLTSSLNLHVIAPPTYSNYSVFLHFYSNQALNINKNTELQNTAHNKRVSLNLINTHTVHSCFISRLIFPVGVFLAASNSLRNVFSITFPLPLLPPCVFIWRLCPCCTLLSEM